jgi:DNA-binding transcriptional ArsR family regulator/rhodanese-related sulfurtransferase
MIENLPTKLYEELAAIGKALSSPKRLRLLNLLSQGEFSVEDIAERLGESTANTSAHLKSLREAGLLESRRDGRKILYSNKNPKVTRLWLALRDFGIENVSEVRELMRTHADGVDVKPDLWGEDLLEKVQEGEIHLIDLRSEEEFEAGHLPGARSIPYEELEERLDELPGDKTIAAYCRGPFCTTGLKGAETLDEAGFEILRIPAGVSDWQTDELPIEQSKS